MQTPTLLHGKRIVLGVTGSIAAYKAVDLASKLTQAGALVDVILTAAAQQFVTALTFQAVTGRAVYTDLWQTDGGGSLPTHIAHVGLGEGAALLMIAPATAHTLAKLAAGMADDLLTVTALAARCPVLVAPAMDGGMYEHPATQANIATLQARGVTLIAPEVGRFASGLVGQGRLPETPTLIGRVRLALAAGGSLAGRHVLVSAGGTREPLDPVRFITNRSSGKQGYAIAQAALDAGASVTLVSAADGLPVPVGAQLVAVESAEQMHDAIHAHLPTLDTLIMAAAVADYRPAQAATHKIKKQGGDDETLNIALVRNPDILLSVQQARANAPRLRAVVGFAAESDNVIAYAQQKLARKGVDLLVANDISAADAGFSVDTNRVTLLTPHAPPEPLTLMSKADVAAVIVERVARLLTD